MLWCACGEWQDGGCGGRQLQCLCESGWNQGEHRKGTPPWNHAVPGGRDQEEHTPGPDHQDVGYPGGHPGCHTGY